MADFVSDWAAKRMLETPESNDEQWSDSDDCWCRIIRLRDCVIVRKGRAPRVAIFTHIDTTGFTVGYGGALIPIGQPQAVDGDRFRLCGDAAGTSGVITGDGEVYTLRQLEVAPGDRVVYAAKPVVDGHHIHSPYLDNRAGMWAAMQALLQCQNVAVTFTTGEETSTSGAQICARYVYDKLGITRALISDITWDTEHVHCGSGVAISRRDHYVPSQGFVDQVVAIAANSGIPYQIEIESEGGSDGAGIERSGCPIDWAFVGAPEIDPHTSHEKLDLGDLDKMARLLITVVNAMTEPWSPDQS